SPSTSRSEATCLATRSAGAPARARDVRCVRTPSVLHESRRRQRAGNVFALADNAVGPGRDGNGAVLLVAQANAFLPAYVQDPRHLIPQIVSLLVARLGQLEEIRVAVG